MGQERRARKSGTGGCVVILVRACAAGGWRDRVPGAADMALDIFGGHGMDAIRRIIRMPHGLCMLVLRLCGNFEMALGCSFNFVFVGLHILNRLIMSNSLWRRER